MKSSHRHHRQPIDQATAPHAHTIHHTYMYVYIHYIYTIHIHTYKYTWIHTCTYIHTYVHIPLLYKRKDQKHFSASTTYLLYICKAQEHVEDSYHNNSREQLFMWSLVITEEENIQKYHVWVNLSLMLSWYSFVGKVPTMALAANRLAI